MTVNKHPAGYVGKKDMMRESAKKLLKGDTDQPLTGSYPSASAPQFLKMRPYKKGGSVKGSELHIPGELKQKKEKLGPLINKKSGFLPKKADKMKTGGAVKGKIPAPIRAGTHPMIGSKKKSPKLAGATKPKVNKSVKAKQSQPYDASKGTYC
jgi:hypothetical protein